MSIYYSIHQAGVKEMIRQLTDPRELRGLAILSQPNTVIQTGENEWDVRSQSIDAYYHVVRSYQDRHEGMRGQAVLDVLMPRLPDPKHAMQAHPRRSTLDKDCR